MEEKTNVLMYQTEDGKTKIDIKFEDETLWMTQKSMAELFQVDRSVITKHVNNVFKDGELPEDSVSAKFAHTAGDGKTYNTQFYNLDMVFAIGYRVRSNRGNQFRRWASEILKEYTKKGFALNDARLKEIPQFGDDYFEELEECLRDIRSSEKRFYQKILAVYATSADYDGQTEMSKLFFKTVQNKLHFSVSGQTAAEIVYTRSDADKKNAGLTNFPGSRVRKNDVTVAKNYLDEEELAALNNIVSMYLGYAEDQARRRNPMYMKDWIEKLDAFLRFNERDILPNASAISHEEALQKALGEYERFNRRRINEEKLRVEDDFEGSIKQLEDLTKKKKK